MSVKTEVIDRQKVVGILRGISKRTGKEFTVLHVVKDWDDYQLENADGSAVDTHYIKGHVEIDVGDEFEPVYGVGYEGKAIVRSVTILS